MHSDVARPRAAEGPQHEGKGLPHAEENPQEHRDDPYERSQPGVLLPEERHRSPVNDARKLCNPIIFDGALRELLKDRPGVSAAKETKDQSDEHKNQPHSEKPPTLIFWTISDANTKGGAPSSRCVDPFAASKTSYCRRL